MSKKNKAIAATVAAAIALLFPDRTKLSPYLKQP
jgi:hypothetical protein